MKTVSPRIETEQKLAQILKKIAVKRKLLKISQTDIAAKLNMTLSGYFKVEKGKSKLDLIRLFEISEILEINLQELFQD